MKLLFDQNLSLRLCRALDDVFPGSVQVRQLHLDRANDHEIREYAGRHGFVLVTQDADFYQLALLHGIPPKILWLRCGNQPTAFIEALLRSRLSEILSFVDDPQLECLQIYPTSRLNSPPSTM